MSLFYFVYLLKCSDSSLYCGITTDVKRRLAEHKAGKGGNYTRSHGAVKMVYIEERETRSLALKREAEIKGWSRAKKLNLINEGRPSGSEEVLRPVGRM